MNALPGSSPLLASVIGGWEAVFLVVLILTWFCARRLPELWSGVKRAIEGFQRAVREVTHEIRGEEVSSEVKREDDRKARRDDLSLWLAQGFDVGRIPLAPGTFGSLVGVLWFAFLLVPGSLWLYVIGTLLGLAASVKYCGEAERILGEQDPGSVVLDEIAAIPICFLPWVLVELWRLNSMPPVELFFSGNSLWKAIGVYVLFRVFDIWKPWPVRQIQNLPGGWGVTADDVLAAFYVALVSLFVVF